MPITHTNRKGDVYYLQAGKTKTGKPRYWFGRKSTGEPVESVPAGFEIYEHPEAGLVLLRKTKPTEISRMERDVVADGVRRYAGLEHFIVDVDPDALVIYLPGMSESEADKALNFLPGPFWGMTSRWLTEKTSMITRSNYTKMMRFSLTNRKERLFVVERWCFKGRIDNWIRIDGPAPLADIVRKYGQHLGQESFFELF